jgi:hypothetical protein
MSPSCWLVLRVAMSDDAPLSSSSPSNRETVRAARTSWHRHHPPEIKKAPSDSYAEIGTDRLRVRPAEFVREFEDASVTIRLLIATPVQRVSRVGSVHRAMRAIARAEAKRDVGYARLRSGWEAATSVPTSSSPRSSGATNSARMLRSVPGPCRMCLRNGLR